METTTRYEWSSLGSPPKHDPVPVVGYQGRITGRRVILFDRDAGWTYDYRAWGEPEMDAECRVWVPVISEFEWYRWKGTGQQPRPQDVTRRLFNNVWLESGQIRF